MFSGILCLVVACAAYDALKLAILHYIFTLYSVMGLGIWEFCYSLIFIRVKRVLHSLQCAFVLFVLFGTQIFVY